jgi:glutaredoxin
MAQRRVEVFTGGCPLCEEAVRLVRETACPSCEVTVYDLAQSCASQECRTKAQQYGVTAVPTIVIDGKIADCCTRDKLTRETLLAVGIGQPR